MKFYSLLFISEPSLRVEETYTSFLKLLKGLVHLKSPCSQLQFTAMFEMLFQILHFNWPILNPCDLTQFSASTEAGSNCAESKSSSLLLVEFQILFQAV